MSLINRFLTRAAELLSGVVVRHALVEGEPHIATHSGAFHADETTATALLMLLPRFRGHAILRTRDAKLLAKCAIVLDVGGEYDGARTFDHHQAAFKSTFSSEFSTRLSSCGLVYLHFGQEILHELHPRLTNRDILQIFPLIYRSFVEHVDANDNGISASDEPRYSITTDLPHRVSKLNPGWQEDSTSEELQAARFREAMVLGLSDFLSSVDFYATEWLESRAQLRKDLETMKASEHKELLFLSGRYPWKSNLLALEPELGLAGQTRFAIYSDGGSWRVQAVPKKEEGFEFRQGVLPGCEGLRDAELSARCGIADCVFVHASGFIGGNATREGATAMALASLRS